MDISEHINSPDFFNKTLRSYKEDMRGSWVSDRKRINEVSEIPFSYITDIYFEIIQKYIINDRSFHRTIHGINRFIDSCLLMGELLYKAKSSGIPIISYCCESAFTLATALYPDQFIRDKEHLKFLNIIVRLHTTSDNVVHIHIQESESRADYKECEFACSQSYCVDHRLQGMNIRPVRDGSTYMIMNERFNPPPYDKLPLYINVPFLNEYARYMFENPPSPLPTFKMPIKFF